MQYLGFPSRMSTWRAILGKVAWVKGIDRLLTLVYASWLVSFAFVIVAPQCTFWQQYGAAVALVLGASQVFERRK